MAAFLVVQHGDLETQKRFLPELRLRVEEGEAQASHWALMLDRVRMREGLAAGPWQPGGVERS
jgi:hypothetical protein